MLTTQKVSSVPQTPWIAGWNLSWVKCRRFPFAAQTKAVHSDVCWFFVFLERGMCVPTVAICFLLLYVEVAIRLRDSKTIPLSIDLCRPFAAHW